MQTRAFCAASARLKYRKVATIIQADDVTIPPLLSVTNHGPKVGNRCDMETRTIKMCTNTNF